MLVDHIDLRVRDFDAARAFYDPLMIAMGFSQFDIVGRDINYHRPGAYEQPFFGLMEDSEHRANGCRIALRASTREEVDRLAEIAFRNGARAFEAPENYGGSPRYYAAFFEDPDGNRLEIAFRE
ncbi:MAG TPA: VOC family protein [Candidatus Aquilonibacter sp.]|nr:VOC family protein [Candidatus Aquilonibacter sp.]